MPNQQHAGLGTSAARTDSTLGLHCFHLLKANTEHIVFSDTIELQHSFLTTAALFTDDRLLHASHTLTAALSDAPQITSDHQLTAIADLKDLFQQWRHKAPLPRVMPAMLPSPLLHPRTPSHASPDPTSRELTPAPMVLPATSPLRVHAMPASDTKPWITIPP